MEREQCHKDASEVYTSDDFEEREQHLEEQDAVIWKVVPEPSGLASFDEDLEEEIDMTNLKEHVPKAHHAYLNIFSERQSQRLPEHSLWDHAIDLKPTFKPQALKIYALSPEKHDKLGKFIKEHLARGTIRRSTSHSTTPFFFVGKKDGALRPCQDYRYLNEGTIKNTYPLPLISELMDQFKGASIFTKMDLRSGYNNVRIKNGDQWKGTFKTNRGLFELMVMFFGLCNSPATFQMMMNALFEDMIDEGWIVIYMDDILIFSNNLEEHHARTRRILQ